MPSTSILHTVRRATAALLFAGTVGAAALASGSGTAMAPEPAKLKAALGSTAARTAAATYVNTATPTQVRFYPSGWVADGYGPAAGTPCSSESLATDAITTHVIQAAGNYRRCL